jgi:hypothetical protein
MPPLTHKGEEIKRAMEKSYGPEKGEKVFYASKNKGTISGVDCDSAGGKLGNFSREQARVFGKSPVTRADATPPLNQRGPGGETWKQSSSPIDAHMDSMRKGFKK